MQLRHLKVKNFRGIRELDWPVASKSFVCLIGPGDSTKSTVLDAIEFCLTSRWNLSFSDADFYGARHDSPIIIECTVADVPEKLCTENKYGLLFRGWDKRSESIIDEPGEEDEQCLTIRLTVDSSLEPLWAVISERNPDGVPISSRDRALLGVVRLGHDLERHFSWSRGSALSALSEGKGQAGTAVVSAYRAARQEFSGTSVPSLQEAAETVQEEAAAYGVRPRGAFRPALDSRTLFTSLGAVSLHDGEIPLRASGLGTRRLTALAMQGLGVEQGGIVLLDEVESGLEPFRLRNLLKSLRDDLTIGLGQVLTTTHSPVAVCELTTEELSVVRADGAGKTVIQQVPDQLQGLVRKSPEALLARKIVVCEGKTEIGLCLGLRTYWTANHDDLPPSFAGVTFENGNGSEAEQIATKFAQVGYLVLMFVDSDNPPNVERIAAAGIALVCWELKEAVCTEQRVFSDLPWPFIADVVAAACFDGNEEKVWKTVQEASGISDGFQRDLDWLKACLGEATVRSVLAKASRTKDREWFKRIDRGERLGEVIASALPQIAATDLATKLSALANWIYE